MAGNMFRPTMPGGIGGPYPFNANDVLVWKNLICKYVCKDGIQIFNKDEFYAALLGGEFSQGGAYADLLSKATKEQMKLFDKLLYYSLNSLSKIGLLSRSVITQTVTEYRSTSRLDIFCPDIMKYDMVDIDDIVEPVLRAEEEIHKYANFSAIIAMLKDLREGKLMDIDSISSNVDISTINKLNQLGTIFLTLNGEITISPIGRKVISDLIGSSASQINDLRNCP
jgi:hypothetical protein